MSDRLNLDARVHHDGTNRVTILCDGVPVAYVDVEEGRPEPTIVRDPDGKRVEGSTVRTFRSRIGPTRISVDQWVEHIGYAGATTAPLDIDPALLPGITVTDEEAGT